MRDGCRTQGFGVTQNSAQESNAAARSSRRVVPRRCTTYYLRLTTPLERPDHATVKKNRTSPRGACGSTASRRLTAAARGAHGGGCCASTKSRCAVTVPRRYDSAKTATRTHAHVDGPCFAAAMSCYLIWSIMTCDGKHILLDPLQSLAVLARSRSSSRSVGALVGLSTWHLVWRSWRGTVFAKAPGFFSLLDPASGGVFFWLVSLGLV